jgi:N-acetylglucosaminyldiphosphoundecaprenol N-acetyl-beta-D-mannosaminyltransferase
MCVRHANVIGSRIDAAPRDVIVQELERCIAEQRREYVCFVNAHLAATARRDERLADALDAAGFALADGAPVAWTARTPRVAGSDVFEELCDRSPALGYRHFFLGATDETLALLRTRVAARYPGIEICGSYSPPFGPELFECVDEICERVNDARPDLVWVGLGAPKQELWMRRARPLLEAPLVLGVGAVFDFAAGNKRRAPQFMQRFGLEWMHRLVSEPRRLWRRYLVTNTAFALALAAERLGRTHAG